MRTNIIIDDNLMQQTLQATGIKTKKEAVEQGLKLRLHKSQQQKIPERNLSAAHQREPENRRRISGWRLICHSGEHAGAALPGLQQRRRGCGPDGEDAAGSVQVGGGRGRVDFALG